MTEQHVSEQYDPVEAGETATTEATPEVDLEATEQELVTEPASDGVVADAETPSEEPAAEADQPAEDEAAVDETVEARPP